jgi:hypothetical protein
LAPIGPDSIATAPDFHGAQSAAKTSPAAGASQTQSSTAAAETPSANPFAQAFIDHVNGKFSGDIGKALSDKQTRGYAQALGIIEPSQKDFDLPADRVELIKRIMQDPQGDSLTKVSTIRLLIKH